MKALLMNPVEAVYRSHHDRLWRSLLTYTGDADVASEAAAETYSQAVGRGQELLDPGAWIWRTAFRIAGGLLADRRRTVGAAQVSPEVEHGPADRAGLDSSLVEFLDLPAHAVRSAAGGSDPALRRRVQADGDRRTAGDIAGNGTGATAPRSRTPAEDPVVAAETADHVVVVGSPQRLGPICAEDRALGGLGRSGGRGPRRVRDGDRHGETRRR